VKDGIEQAIEALWALAGTSMAESAQFGSEHGGERRRDEPFPGAIERRRHAIMEAGAVVLVQTLESVYSPPQVTPSFGAPASNTDQARADQAIRTARASLGLAWALLEGGAEALREEPEEDSGETPPTSDETEAEAPPSWVVSAVGSLLACRPGVLRRLHLLGPGVGDSGGGAHAASSCAPSESAIYPEVAATLDAVAGRIRKWTHLLASCEGVEAVARTSSWCRAELTARQFIPSTQTSTQNAVDPLPLAARSDGAATFPCPLPAERPLVLSCVSDVEALVETYELAAALALTLRLDQTPPREWERE